MFSTASDHKSMPLGHIYIFFIVTTCYEESLLYIIITLYITKLQYVQSNTRRVTQQLLTKSMHAAKLPRADDEVTSTQDIVTVALLLQVSLMALYDKFYS